MDRAMFVYTTFPSLVEAEEIGGGLVTDGLAACVNIFPQMRSIYRWQGAIERADEVVMIVKTRESLAEAVRARVKERHSYTTPAIVFLPVEGGEPGYVQWLLDETAAAAGVAAGGRGSG